MKSRNNNTTPITTIVTAPAPSNATAAAKHI